MKRLAIGFLLTTSAVAWLAVAVLGQTAGPRPLPLAAALVVAIAAASVAGTGVIVLRLRRGGDGPGGSRFGREERRSLTSTVEASNRVLRQSFDSFGIMHQAGTETELVGRLGSGLKVRLLGAQLASPDSLPVIVRARTSPTPGGSEVRVAVSENFGFGSLVGVEDRFQSRCAQLATQIADDVEARTSRTHASPG